MRFLFGTIGVFAAAGVLLAGCELLNGKKEKPHPPSIPGKIVFSMADDSEMENYQIYVMNTDGSDMKQLTHFESDEAFLPSWSPDGEQIVFSTSLRSSSAGASLYVMNADGSNIRPLKERPNTHVVTAGYHPKWSPDGSKIAFDFCDNCNAGGKNYEVFVYDFVTDSVIQITDHPASDSYPVWSPGGEKLAFVSGREYFTADTLRFRKDLYVINLHINEIERITSTGYVREPLWKQNGNEITFRNTDSIGGIYDINITSKQVRSIGGSFSNTLLLYPVSYSPAGDKLLIKTRDHPLDTFQLFNTETKENIAIEFGPKEFVEADWHYTEN